MKIGQPRENKMSKQTKAYQVTVRQTRIVYYMVEAANENKAREEWTDGKVTAWDEDGEDVLSVEEIEV